MLIQALSREMAGCARLPLPASADKSVPTSRQIITEVSGMSPNICQLCVRAMCPGYTSRPGITEDGACHPLFVAAKLPAIGEAGC
ncbi:hypothetical protein GFM44_14620 [Rhizobium leguminosarum bv. viciae]|nr:hypothetical protein [Rhizobium leguminosarum bv. viciae]